MSTRIVHWIAVAVASLLVPIAGASIASAQITSWLGGSSQYWSNTSNWSNGLPTGGSILRTVFSQQNSSQVSPINDLNGAVLTSVWLGTASSGIGGFNITGNAVQLNGYSALGYGMIDYGNNTWGINTTFGSSTGATFDVVNANSTLTLSGLITPNGDPVTVEGAGNVVFSQPTQGFDSLVMKGTGSVTVPPIPNLAFGGTLVVAGSGLNTNFGDITVSSGNVNLGNYIGWAGEFGENYISISSGGSVTMQGPLAVPPANGVQHGGLANVILGTGTLILAQTGSSLTNPDISSSFVRSDLVGDIISTNVQLSGTSQRYIVMWAQGYQQSSSQGEGTSQFSGADINFAGKLLGTGGLTFDGEPSYFARHYAEAGAFQSTMALENNDSSWTGSLEIHSGNVILSNASALNSANAVSFTPADSLHQAGLYLNGNTTAIGSLSGTASSPMLLVNGGTSSVTLTINQTTDGTFAGQIGDGPDQGWGGGQGIIQGGSLALVKQGNNALTLSGTNNYSGGTTLNAGLLRITSPKALGQSYNSFTVNGGTLDLYGQSGVTIGALNGSGGIITNNGPLAANIATVVPVGTSATFGSLISDGSKSITFAESGGGALTLTATQGYSGGTSLSGGTLALQFGSGAATNILRSGGPLAMQGTLALNGGNSETNAQTLGNVTFTPGGSSIVLSPGSGGSLSLTAGNTWTRQAGSALQVNLSSGTLLTSPALSASSNVVVGTPAAGTSATAFAVVSGAGTTDWATVNGGQIAALSSGGYANNAYGAGKNSNVTTLNPSPSAFSTDTLAFRTAQANTLTLTGLNTLNLGGLLVGTQVGANTTAVNGGSLTSASNELIVQQYNTSGGLTLGAQVSNNGGTPLLLTKAGPGSMTLNNPANSYSGGTVIAGGTLVLGSNTALGATSGGLTVGGGTLDLGGLSPTVGSLSGNTGAILSSSGSATLTVNSSSNSTLGALIANGGGTVTLTKTGAGTLVLTGSNTYSGGTNILGGAVSVAQDANLGSAANPLYINGGTLTVTAAGEGKTFSSYSTASSWASGGITDNVPSTTRPISWGSSGATINITDPTNTFTISQQLTTANCQGNLVKTGPGTLWLSAPNLTNNWSGTTTVMGGAVVLDYSGDPGYGDVYKFQQKIGSGQLILGGARVAEFDSGPGYYGPGAAIYLGATVDGLSLLPGDSILQTNLEYSGFDLTGGTANNSTGLVTRQAGGSLYMQGAVDFYNVSPLCSSPGTVNGWITTSSFVDSSPLTPVPAQQYNDVEFASLSAGSYTTTGSVAVIQPNVGLWTAGQDVTNATALNASGTDSFATVTGSNAFTGSLPANLAIDSLRIMPAAASNIDLGGHTLTVSSGGILMTFNAVNNSSAAVQISDGTLTASNANYGGDLIVQQFGAGVAYPQYSSVGQALQISAVIANAPKPAGRNGSTTMGSTTISGLASTSDLYPGMPISGTGIPAGATITAISSSSSITISTSATATGTPTLALTSANGLTKSAAGELILSGNNTYTGPTYLNAGVTLINGNQSAATGPVTVAYGATLGGTGTVGGAVTIQDGGTLAPGINTVSGGTVSVLGTPGTLTMGAGLDMSAASAVGANLDWRLGALSTSSGFDTVSLTNGSLLLGGLSKLTLDFSLLSAANSPGAASPASFWLSAESWKIIGLSGGATNPGSTNFASLINDTFADGSFSTSVGTGVNAGSIFLNYTPAISANQWNDVSGNWSNSANWSAGSVPSGVGATANFLSNITANRTVTVDTPETVGTINFNSSNSYLLSGANAITLQVASGTAAINVTSGSQQISAPVTLASSAAFSVQSGATLAISGNITANNNPLNVNGGGTVALSGTDTTSNLTVPSGSLAISGSLKVADLNVTLTTSGTGQGAGQISGNGTIMLTDGLFYNSTAASTFAGAIKGSSDTTMEVDGGMLTLSGSNTYPGGTTVTAGEISVSSSANLGAGGGLTLGGGTLQLTGAASFHDGESTVLTAPFTYDVESTTPATFSGPISGSGGALVKTGPGTLVLSGSDTYQGGTTVTEGELVFNNTSALPAGSSLTVGDWSFSNSSLSAPLSAGSVVAAVPEPSTAALLCIAAAMIGTVCRRRVRRLHCHR